MNKIKKYNKLVRDNIPELIKQDGNNYLSYIADDIEYREMLLKKLKEETNELIDNPCLEEIADVLEVIDAIKKHFCFSDGEVLKVKHEKYKKRGGFETKTILKEVIIKN